MRVKEYIKDLCMRRMHLVDAERFALLDNLATVGIEEFACLDYNRFTRHIRAYLESLEVTPHSYLFAKSRKVATLYGSVYAVMLKGLMGVLPEYSSDDLKSWGEYLNSYQREDGFYYDSNLSGPAYEHVGIWNEGWGKRHLLGHMIIALARLGVLPKYEFQFLGPFYDKDYLIRWMNSFDFDSDVWTDSNYFMNLYTALQYSRDWLNDSLAGGSVSVMAEWLLNHQSRETGMWHKRPYAELDIRGKLFTVRGAYHFYPLFEYDHIDVPYRDKIVDSILPLQNRWGAFAQEEWRSGACEEIDALEPLMRFSKELDYRPNEVKAAVLRSLIWCLSSRCADGGFSFYPCAGQEYGGHPLTTNLKGESSLFATWFRTLTLAYQMRFLGIENSFNIGHYPGYEIS